MTSATQRTEWLGRRTLDGAILAAIAAKTAPAPHSDPKYDFLRQISSGGEIPADCDPRFVEFAKFLVTGKDPDPACHKEFEKSWQYFQALCRLHCASVNLVTVALGRRFQTLRALNGIARWLTTLDEVWSLPRYRTGDSVNVEDERRRRTIGFNEGIFIWRSDPQGRAFLDEAQIPPFELLPEKDGGSLAHEAMASSLCAGIGWGVLRVHGDRQAFLRSLASWLGRADRWPNCSWHPSLWPVGGRLQLGEKLENADEETARKVAYAWPDVAFPFPGRRLLPNADWPEATKEKWLEGYMYLRRCALPADPEEAKRMFYSSSSPFDRHLLWGYHEHRSQRVGKSGNPFDTVRQHPFTLSGEQVKEPPCPAYEAWLDEFRKGMAS